jgi:hypothetical protein
VTSAAPSPFGIGLAVRGGLASQHESAPVTRRFGGGARHSRGFHATHSTTGRPGAPIQGLVVILLVRTLSCTPDDLFEPTSGHAGRML